MAEAEAPEKTGSKRGPGQPTKLTPELQEKILHYIRMGCYACVAAAAVGIGESTYYLWLARGERELDGPYVEFLKAVKSAEAVAEARCVEMVQLAAPDNWQAAMTLMERRWPERWRRRDSIDVRLGKMTNEQLAAFIAEDVVEDARGNGALAGLPALPAPGEAVGVGAPEGTGSAAGADSDESV